MSIFKQVKGLRPKRNNFNLSHDNKLSHDLGVIVPCFVWKDLIPGSKCMVGVNQLTRLQALMAPIMQNVNSYIQFWKIPYRILDAKFSSFISGIEELDPDFDYRPPYFTYKSFSDACSLDSTSIDKFFFSGSLMDFLGYPPVDTLSSSISYSNLPTKHLTIRPIQAYCTIIKNWYLNENISSSTFNSLLNQLQMFSSVSVEDYQDYGQLEEDCSQNLYDLLKELKKISPSMCFPHAWSKDYFTSALPFVQVGDPVTLNLADTAPLTAKVSAGSVVNLGDGTLENVPNIIMDTSYSSDFALYGKPVSNPNAVATLGDDQQGNVRTIQGKLGTDLSVTGTADLSDASAISILEFRVANALQSYKELTARIGHRFNEWLKGTFNVESRDARLQLPEWLGGGKVPVNVADIEQTAPQASTSTPLGWLGGKGTAFAGDFAGFKTFIEEPSLIIGLLFVQPKSDYCNQGFHRSLTKLTDRFDFFHPKFEHIGEQAIDKSELLLTGSGTFGYQSRYAEYKWWGNEIHGQFNTSLDFWHMARKFNSVPTLSPTFIYCQQSEMLRNFAVQEVKSGSVQPCISWLHFDVIYKAPMSKFGTPMLLN